MLATLVGFCQCSVPTESGPRHYALFEKHTITNNDVRRFRQAIQKHPETFPADEINLSARHVAIILSEIVRNFHNSIMLTTIALCMDVTAYSDFCGCAFETNLEVNQYLIFRMTAKFSQNVLCQRRMHKDTQVESLRGPHVEQYASVIMQ